MNNLKKRTKNAKGITLVALVITVIIIIILSTVAISFAFGNNGLIRRAEDAKWMYANDTAYTDGSIANVESYINEILGNDKGSTQEPEQPEEPVITTIEETLEEGDYVYFTDGTGTQRTCVVLYGPENTNYSSYGIQIITMNIVEDIKLGVLNDISASRTSYNNGISTLNNATSKYLNTTYATKVRSVGSVPNNPTYDAAGMFTMSAEDNWTGYFTQYNGTFKDSDDNYVADWEQMSNLNIYNIEDTYWLASRLVEVDSSSYVEIGLREVSSSGKLRGSGTTLLAAQRPEDNLIDEVTQGLRPVFTLKAGLKVTGGAGTSTSPYTLGV